MKEYSISHIPVVLPPVRHTAVRELSKMNLLMTYRMRCAEGILQFREGVDQICADIIHDMIIHTYPTGGLGAAPIQVVLSNGVYDGIVESSTHTSNLDILHAHFGRAADGSAYYLYLSYNDKWRIQKLPYYKQASLSVNNDRLMQLSLRDVYGDLP